MSPNETSATIRAWGEATFGAVADLAVLTGRARIEFAELEEALKTGDPGAIGAEAADIVILLHRLCGLLDRDLSAEVDAKMAVNRARRWRASGDGVGEHI